MKEDRDSDRKAAQTFIESTKIGSLDDMSTDDKIEILRGVCYFLLLQLQKTYIFIERNSATEHDSLLYGEMGYVLSKAEEMLTLFFPDHLEKETEQEDEGTG